MLQKFMDSQRNAIILVLLLNAGMFIIEIASGHYSRSAALQADAMDFLADAINMAVSLFLIGLPVWSARIALIKAFAMAGFGIFVLYQVWSNYMAGVMPGAQTMGIVGALALLANVLSVVILWLHRSSDANMRSIWICSRNDALSNLAVLLAAYGVYGTGTAFPDLLIATMMAALGITGAISIGKMAISELSKHSTVSREKLAVSPQSNDNYSLSE